MPTNRAMARVDCDYCGLPFKVRRVLPGEKVYCCAGCALADRVKSAPGQFPVTAELVLALLAGFAAFNQVLCIVMSWLMAGEGRAVLGERFWWASLVAGALAWALTTLAQFRSGARRAIDHGVALAGFVLLVLGGIAASPLCALAGPALVLLWSARGWTRPRRSRDGAKRLQE